MLDKIKALGPVVTIVILALSVFGIFKTLTSSLVADVKMIALPFEIAMLIFMVYSTAILSVKKSKFNGRQNQKPRKNTKTAPKTARPAKATSTATGENKPRANKPQAKNTVPKEGPVTLHINNLASDVFETHLREIFSGFGDINSVRIISEKETGESKGFGFVEMALPADAEKAIAAVNGKELSGKAISVSVAKSRGPRRPYNKKN